MELLGHVFIHATWNTFITFVWTVFIYSITCLYFAVSYNETHSLRGEWKLAENFYGDGTDTVHEICRSEWYISNTSTTLFHGNNPSKSTVNPFGIQIISMTHFVIIKNVIISMFRHEVCKGSIQKLQWNSKVVLWFTLITYLWPQHPVVSALKPTDQLLPGFIALTKVLFFLVSVFKLSGSVSLKVLICMWPVNFL